MPQTKMNTYGFHVNHRTVLRIAIPSTLAYLSTPLLGLVDTAVIGQLGEASLIGGIAVGGVIFDLVFTTFNFLRSGTTGLTAQALGARIRSEMSAVLFRALMIAFSAGFLLLLVQWPVITAGLYFLGGTDSVQEATRQYFSIRVYSAPFVLANYALLGWVLGLGRATTGLLIQSFLNGLNILLSILFVLILDWGVAGVAAATVISEAATFVLGIAIAFRIAPREDWPPFNQLLDRSRFLKLFALNRDIMIRSFSLLFAFAFFTSRSSVQGDVLLAANAILIKFFLFTSYFLDGFATAAEQFAGRSIGAKDRAAFTRTVILTLLWGGMLALFSAAFLLLFGDWAVAVITPSSEIQETVAMYLIWAVLTPICGVLAFQMDGIFIGATWSQEIRNMMLVSLFAYLITYYLFFPMLGNHGLWLALEIFLCARGISLFVLLPGKVNRTFQPN